jgi:DNA-binding NarL/FixJ family response regulator
VHWEANRWQPWRKKLDADLRAVSPLFRGMALARDWQPHVVVVGRTIAPGESGLAVVPELRELASDPYVLVVAKRYSEPEAQQALSRGADGYFDEADVDGLLRAVRAATKQATKLKRPVLRVLDGGLPLRSPQRRRPRAQKPDAA